MLRAPAAPFVVLLGFACAVSCTELPTIEAVPGPVDGGGVDAGIDAGALPDADALPDGSSVDPEPDAGPSNCVLPKGYTVDCTTAKNGCSPASVATNVTYGGETLFYPHGLALSGDGWLYFAVQKKTLDGRNAKDMGALFRTRLPLSDTSAKIEAITGIVSAPRAVAFGFGYVYWAQGPTVYRLSHPAPACGSGCALPTLVGSLPATVTALVVRGPNEILAASPSGLVSMESSGAASAMTTLSGADGRLSGRPGGTAYYATSSRILAVSAGQARDLVLAPSGVGDLDVAAGCNDVVPFSTNNGNVYRIVGGAASPLACSGAACGALTFDGALDATSAYFARPNGAGLFRLPRVGSGNPVKLVGGDVWDVAVDDVAVYGTDVDGAKIVSVPKT